MITLVTPSFYYLVIILIALCLLDILYVAIIRPMSYKNKALKLIKEASNSKEYEILKVKEDDVTFALKTNNKTYNIKVIMTSKNCDIQINNKETFMIYKKANAEAMKYKQLPDMAKFMNSKKENRVILITKKAHSIKKVVNECEMIMVTPETKVYNVNILNSDQYDFLFK